MPSLTPIHASEPGSELHRRWRRSTRRPWLSISLLAVLAGKLALCRDEAFDCARAVREGNNGTILAICYQEFSQTHAPTAGISVANALRQAGDPDLAAAIAETLLTSPREADALYVLGKVAVDRRQDDKAIEQLSSALALHRRDQQLAGAAKDQLALADVLNRSHRDVEAMAQLNGCIDDAQRAKAAMIEGFCHVALARVFTKIGFVDGAVQSLARARSFVTGEQRVWLELEEGNVLQESGDDAQAVLLFERAVRSANHGSWQRPAVAAHLNLAQALIDLYDRRRDAPSSGDTTLLDKAKAHLDQANRRDVENRKKAPRLLIEAELQFHLGHLPLASWLAQRSFDQTDAEDLDDRAEIQTLLAMTNLQQEDLILAERWARGAIADIEVLRANQPMLQLRSWVRERHRRSFEVLFTSLAQRGDARAALASFDAWRSQARLDGLSVDPKPRPAQDPDSTRRLAGELRRLLPALQTRAWAGSSHDERGAPLVDPDILVLVVASGELWSITIRGAEPRLRNLGKLSSVRDSMQRFRANASDPELAAALGELLIPAELGRDTDQALYFVLDTQISSLPVAALRARGQTIGRIRPLIHAANAASLSCWKPRVGRGRPMVIADAQGDLPGARREAVQLSRRMDASLALGADATRAALVAAAGADFLHLAIHTTVDSLGGSLALADGEVSALEIAGWEHVPSRVALATCNSAVAPGGTYSVALGFVFAGADQVLATLRPLDDDAAARITEMLYRDDATDLAKALWVARRGTTSDDPDLAQLIVLGSEPCTSR
jgi:tetratricopeptide (TPR) repeat protein